MPSLTDMDTEAPVGQEAGTHTAPPVLGHSETGVERTPACALAPVQVLPTGSGLALPAHPTGPSTHSLPPSRDSAQVPCSTHKDEGRHSDPGGLCQAATSRICSEQVTSLRSVTRERCGHGWAKGPPSRRMACLALSRLLCSSDPRTMGVMLCFSGSFHAVCECL